MPELGNLQIQTHRYPGVGDPNLEQWTYDRKTGTLSGGLGRFALPQNLTLFDFHHDAGGTFPFAVGDYSARELDYLHSFQQRFITPEGGSGLFSVDLLATGERATFYMLDANNDGDYMDPGDVLPETRLYEAL